MPASGGAVVLGQHRGQAKLERWGGEQRWVAAAGWSGGQALGGGVVVWW
jgi:hypothetical protein